MEIRLPVLADEDDVRAGHAELAAEGFPFALGLDQADSFAQWVRWCAAWSVGTSLPAGWVRSTNVLGLVDGEVVGRVSIRHRMTDFLLAEGGLIGYAVRPAHRGRGHAGVLLAHGLAVLAEEGWTAVLVTCDQPNTASARVIERAGGVLEDVRPVAGTGPPKRRYWVPTTP